MCVCLKMKSDSFIDSVSCGLFRNPCGFSDAPPATGISPGDSTERGPKIVQTDSAVLGRRS